MSRELKSVPLISHRSESSLTLLDYIHSSDISPVRWYQYFVPRPDRSPLDVLSECVPDYQTKFLIQASAEVDERIDRRFAGFETYIDFLQMQSKIPFSLRNFFETIIGNQKIYFDIDIEIKKLQPGHSLDSAAEGVLNSTIRSICKVMKEKCRVDISLQQGILIFQSHSPEKRSFHIVLPEYALPNAKAVESIARPIFEEIPAEYRVYLDQGMYKEMQQFRLFGSQKPGSNRPKAFCKEWYYQGHPVEYQFPQMPPCDPYQLSILEYNWIFELSAVTLTSNCSRLPSAVVYEIEDSCYKPSWMEKGAFQDIPEIELTPEMIKTVLKPIDKLNWEPRVEGNRISLRRLRPSFCYVCERRHEHENAYIWISSKTGGAFFVCWRALNCSMEKTMIQIGSVPVSDPVVDQHATSVVDKYKRFLSGTSNPPTIEPMIPIKYNNVKPIYSMNHYLRQLSRNPIA